MFDKDTIILVLKALFLKVTKDSCHTVYVEVECNYCVRQFIL